MVPVALHVQSRSYSVHCMVNCTWLGPSLRIWPAMDRVRDAGSIILRIRNVSVCLPDCRPRSCLPFLFVRRPVSIHDLHDKDCASVFSRKNKYALYSEAYLHDLSSFGSIDRCTNASLRTGNYYYQSFIMRGWTRGSFSVCYRSGSDV